MKVLVTGAHFTPAVATIEEIKKYPDIEVIYVGRKTTQEGDSSPSAESKVLPGVGVKYISITTGRLQREFTLYTIPSLLRIPIGFIQALYIILKEKPDVILSFGGYVAVPLVLVGWLFSVPIIVHEQTLVSGLANKISYFFADKIALSFKMVDKIKKENVIITGNPIREMVRWGNMSEDFNQIFNTSKKVKLSVILITGGNQGSHAINLIVEACLQKLTKLACIIHVTGESRYKDFERLQNLQNDHYIVKKWIGQEYGALLHKVDLVVSRAGINTLSELAFIGKPALVIPFEPLYQDEQKRNAKYFERLGLVKILPQSELSGDSLMKNLKAMIKNLHGLKQKAKDARGIIIPDAVKRLALETYLLAKAYHT